MDVYINGQGSPTVWEKLIIWKTKTKQSKGERKKIATRNKFDLEKIKFKKKLSLMSHNGQKRDCTHERKTGCYKKRRPFRNKRVCLEN